MAYPGRLTRETLIRIAADAIMINLALAGAFTIRFLGLIWQAWEMDTPPEFFINMLRDSIDAFTSVAPWITGLCLILFYLSGFYTYGRAYRSRYKALVVFQAVTLAYLIFGAFSYLFLNVAAWFPRTVWIAGWLLTLGLVGGTRLWSAVWRATVWTEAKMVRQPKRRAVRSVLVIGGAGYIGSILVRKLLNRGYNVTVLDTLIYGDEAVRDLYGRHGFELIEGDIRNIETVVQALHYTDAVIHLGALVGDPACALDEKVTIEINLAATRMIAEAARGLGVERFIFASTCSVYGASDQILDERSALKPVSLYAKTKIDSEQVLLALNNDDFSPVILRFGTIYGLSPRPRFDLVVNLLAAKAVCEGSVTIFGGNQWRPFVHVDDVAEAVLLSLMAPLDSVKGQIFNVGSDQQNYQIADLGKIIKQLMPSVEVLTKGDDVDKRNYRVSFAKIRRQIGFEPRHTVADGILEIKAAIEEGRLGDYRDARYSNYKSLSDEGLGALIRSTELSSLYSIQTEDSKLVPATSPNAG